MNLLGRIDLDVMHQKILTTDVLSLCIEKIIGWPGGRWILLVEGASGLGSRSSAP